MTYFKQSISGVISENKSKIESMMEDISYELSKSGIDFRNNKNNTEIKIPSSFGENTIRKIIENCIDIPSEALRIFITIKSCNDIIYVRKRLK